MRIASSGIRCVFNNDAVQLEMFSCNRRFMSHVCSIIIFTIDVKGDVFLWGSYLLVDGY